MQPICASVNLLGPASLVSLIEGVNVLVVLSRLLISGMLLESTFSPSLVDFCLSFMDVEGVAKGVLHTSIPENPV